MSDTETRVINPLPPHRLGLQRVRAYPYFVKERWPEADFGDRWRAIKAYARAHQPESVVRGALSGAGRV
jgi:hypothetical protein